MSAPSCTTLDLAAYDSTKAALSENPAAAAGSFATTTTWEDGARARTTARSFVIETDEPSPLGGTDKAVDPMELVLAAVGTCLTIGWINGAARRGVEFRSLRIEVKGDFDLRGYLELDESVRPGFSGLSYAVHVDTDANPAVLEEIKEAAERTSPMFDNVANATPITGQVVAA